MKRIAIAALLAVACVGCDATVAPGAGAASALGNNIAYTRDARTGICFAMVQSQSYSAFYVTSIATVPCEKIPAGLLK